ncbi:MAG: hypothetical protein HQ562_04710 [Candidatus Marinimicrobia bacterium]|nr:hypothetical protein [Candidatus Neomarinimicrobiota bacterium]
MKNNEKFIKDILEKFTEYISDRYTIMEDISVNVEKDIHNKRLWITEFSFSGNLITKKILRNDIALFIMSNERDLFGED